MNNAQTCPDCDDMKIRIVCQADGRKVGETCSCVQANRLDYLYRRARLPLRYQQCTLETYDCDRPGAGPSLWKAHTLARRFVDGYPAATHGAGLLFTGNIGTGKTHLAVAILQALLINRNIAALFCDYRELLKSIGNSYNPQVKATELDVLAPIFAAEVLVIDEFGASKPTEWVLDTVAHIINTRYNHRRTTILTTNYPNAAPAGKSKEETLGDRIGERMRSRLCEMCITVDMHGTDLRQSVKRAGFQ